MAYRKNEKVTGRPYVIVGSTATPRKLSLTLSAGGLKQVLAQCTDDDDLIHLDQFENQEWSIGPEGRPVCKSNPMSYISISRVVKDESE